MQTVYGNMRLDMELFEEAAMRRGMEGVKRRPVLLESFLLVLVTMADAAWTIYLIHSGLAIEANPLMASLLSYGYIPFVAIKTLYLIPLLLVCEWLREFRPLFATTAVRLALIGYLAIYALGEMKLHGII